MQLYVINPLVLLRNNRLTALFGITVVCILVSMAGVGISSGHNSLLSSNDVVKDNNGPTMIMNYSKKKFVKNPIASFMYFVPLIAPTLVDNISSADNTQQMGIISHKINVNSKSFYVACEFEVLGNGFHMNTFNPVGMIAAHTKELKKGEAITNVLDYIKIDGDGFGVIKVKGRISGSNRTVTEVDVQFNVRGHKSAVTIGLYDIKPKDGEYKYENRSNEVVARVNTLTFKKTGQIPRMGITIASIAKKGKSAGFFGSIKGAIANMFIKPPKVDKLGNTAMLEFGYALLQKNSMFTFPKAKNIKESKVVAIGQTQK
jgi:hypothetical protein